MTIDRLYRTSLKRTSEMVIPLANSKNLQIISSAYLYEMDFGVLEGDYVAITCLICANYRINGNSDKPVFLYMMGSTLNRFIRESMDL